MSNQPWRSALLFIGGCLALGTFAQASELRVLSYNILVGGGGLGQPLSQTAEVIAASGADLIGLQEQGGATQQLAAMLGFHYAVQNNDISFLSRYPILETLPSGVRVELPQGQDAYLFNVHLAAYPYQPYDIRDGLITSEAQAITAARSARGAAMNNVLSTMQAPLESGAPVFLVGDFNEPSHLDWTQEAADVGLHFGEKVAWPASTSIVNAGLEDTFRTIHPDEIALPGNTWTPLVSPGEVHDRIDIVYHAGQSVAPLDARIIGENSANADIVITPYPSDHRAVVGRYELLNVGGLTARINRGTGALTLFNSSDTAVQFDGYSLTSTGGFLDPANGAWHSLSDSGAAGWAEANPSNDRLSELNPTGAFTIAPGESVQLGAPYAFVPTTFGAPYTEDVRLRYFTPEGESLLGDVTYNGWRNNLVLTVDPTTGEAILENQSPFDIAFDSYRIVSPSGSLADDAWISLADRALDDWFEANPSAESLAELNPLGASVFPSGARITLGRLFNASKGEHDLALTFLLADENATRSGVVEYASLDLGVPGDTNADGTVDLTDLNAVRNHFGQQGLGVPGDANFDGAVDLADLNAVRNHFGESTSVPEPATAILAILAALCTATRRPALPG